MEKIYNMDRSQFRLFIKLILIVITLILVITNMTIFFCVDTTVIGAFNVIVALAAFMLVSLKFKS